MPKRFSLALVCILTLTGCGTNTAPNAATPSPATPTTPRTTPPPAIVGNEATPVATLLDQPVLARDCLSPSNGIGAVEVGLHSLVLGVLMNDCVDPQSLTLTQTEIDTFWERMRAGAGQGGKVLPPTPPFDEPKAQARLDDVRRKLAAPNLPWLERLTLQGQERGSLYALEHKTVPAALAYSELLPLRCKAAIYKKYGGKVVGMQISMEPAEAFQKLIQDAERSGKLTIHDPQLKQAFWKRIDDTLQHQAVAPELVDFSLPAWLQMRVGSSATPPAVPAPRAVMPTKKNLIFDRWVGRWESTTEYKPTATTEAKTIKGETIVRKVLDDRFLLWQWASETGDSQYMSLLSFDENFGGYRFWTFGSGGEAFERTGQWDAASQTLKLDVKPPTPGVTGISTDRFVGNDQIESTLLVKNADGQITRDLRATWVSKAATVSVDIDFSSGPVAGSEELTLLQKLAGDWTNRSISKPAVWEPDGKTETFTEQVAWTIGGRFLIFRAYDETKRMKSLSLMTYEPKESSYRFWYFAPGVYGGQWRITWDAASREFHWNSIDMPAGWTGTGINRLIDDDTFANQALIKDEQGRVLMDATQDKRRKSP